MHAPPPIYSTTIQLILHRSELMLVFPVFLTAFVFFILLSNVAGFGTNKGYGTQHHPSHHFYNHLVSLFRPSSFIFSFYFRIFPKRRMFI